MQLKNTDDFFDGDEEVLIAEKVKALSLIQEMQHHQTMVDYDGQKSVLGKYLDFVGNFSANGERMLYFLELAIGMLKPGSQVDEHLAEHWYNVARTTEHFSEHPTKWSYWKAVMENFGPDEEEGCPTPYAVYFKAKELLSPKPVWN